MAEQVLVTDAEAVTERRSRKKLVIGLVLLLVLGGVAAAALTGMLPGTGVDGDVAAAPAPPVEGAVVDVADMTASVGGDQPGYVRFGFAAVLVQDADQAAVSSRFALLKDAALTEISQTSLSALRTPEGIDALRAALTARAHGIYPDGEVLRIVLTDLLIQ